MTITYSHCLRCGRSLTSARSTAAGYGPGCAARIRRAHAGLAEWTPRQRDAAAELVADGGIVPVRTARVGVVYRTVATDGSETYLTTAAGHCTCPAGARFSRCYHTAAARMLGLAA